MNIRFKGLLVPLSCVALLFCFLLLKLPAYASGPNPPVPRYVSKSGDNSDGLTWATAWNEMDQIQWNLVVPQRGDTVNIDGGTTRMIYTTPLKIQSSYSPYSPLPVKVSEEAGHNGQAVIYGAGQQDNGVEIISGNCQILGSKKSGLLICGWRGDGLVMPQGIGPHNKVQHLEICKNRGAGLHLTGGFNNIISKNIIHDNRVNVLVDPTGPIMSSFRTSWIYNSTYRTNSDGIIMGDGNNNPYVFVQDCVLGPGLKRGYHFAGASQTGGSLQNCLLINATRSNVSTVKGLTASNLTSFMTKLNPWRRAHACVRIDSNQTVYPNESLGGSVFYGGAVRVDPSIQYSTLNNTQYKTTGNTTFLSPTQVDPLFVTNVGRYRNRVPIKVLINTDFSLQAGSPAAGTGSTITSVSQLLGMF